MLNFIKNIGPTELIVLSAVLTLFFGRKIDIAIGKASGQTLKEIRKLKSEILGTTLEDNKNKLGKDNQKEVLK